MTDTRHLCDIRIGWRSMFWAKSVLLIPDDADGVFYKIPLSSITPGDVLPRETDKPMEL